jgi:hypothetical protein
VSLVAADDTLADDVVLLLGSAVLVVDVDVVAVEFVVTVAAAVAVIGDVLALLDVPVADTLANVDARVVLVVAVAAVPDTSELDRGAAGERGGVRVDVSAMPGGRLCDSPARAVVEAVLAEDVVLLLLLVTFVADAALDVAPTLCTCDVTVTDGTGVVAVVVIDVETLADDVLVIDVCVDDTAAAEDGKVIADAVDADADADVDATAAAAAAAAADATAAARANSARCRSSRSSGVASM